MNLTLDQYMAGLERSVHELPTLLAVWFTLDVDLRAAYENQLWWMLSKRWLVLEMAERRGRKPEIAQRLERVRVGLLDMREAIADAGLEIET